MIDREEYEAYTQEIIAEPDRPHTFHNEQLADEFFTELVKEYPQATIYGGKYICMNSNAIRALCEMMEQRKAKQEEELQNTERLLTEIKATIH
jgi:hypothetical protein